MKNPLTLARMEENPIQIPKTEVPFSGLLTECIYGFSKQMEFRYIHIQAEIQPNIVFCTSREHMEQLIQVLLLQPE